MKLFFYDCETTGLDKERCAIHQLSGKIKIDGKTVETFDFHIKPFENAQIDEGALAVAHVTEQEIMNYTPGEEVYRQLCEMLYKYLGRDAVFSKNPWDKFVTVGYNNAGFDDEFLWWFFKRYHSIPVCGMNQGFSKGNLFNKYLTLDVMRMAQMIIGPSDAPKPENFKLGTVAKYVFGGEFIDESKLHGADYDIDTTINLFNVFYKQYITRYQVPQVNG